MSEFLDDAFHHSEGNIFGGEDYFNEMGSKIGYSESNIFGGENIYDQNQTLVGYSESNSIDGITIMNDHGTPIISTQDMGNDNHNIIDHNS